MDIPKQDVKTGDTVRVNDPKDDFFGQIGEVKYVSEADRCGITLNGYYVEYFSHQLKPLD